MNQTGYSEVSVERDWYVSYSSERHIKFIWIDSACYILPLRFVASCTHEVITPPRGFQTACSVQPTGKNATLQQDSSRFKRQQRQSPGFLLVLRFIRWRRRRRRQRCRFPLYSSIMQTHTQSHTAITPHYSRTGFLNLKAGWLTLSKPVFRNLTWPGRECVRTTSPWLTLCAFFFLRIIFYTPNQQQQRRYR